MAKTIEIFIIIEAEIKEFQHKGLSYNAARRLVYEKYKKELEEIKNAKKN